jgi:LysR family glycine cleavage system transcriptional activator
MPLSRRGLPSLNALRAFEAAGRKLSFRAAAAELGVTQGAVAQQIRALEDHLGIRLFNRLARGLSLTPQGAAWLADVTRAFDMLVESTDRLLARPDVVTISVTPTVAARLLIPRLGQLQADLPDIESRTALPATLESALLFRQHLIAVASPHLLEGLSLPLTARQIASLPLLHDAHDGWPRFLQQEGKLPGARFNQTTLALDAAMAGQGVALTSRAFVQADIKAGRLVVVADAGDSAGDYYLVRKRMDLPGRAAQAVWEWCLDHLGECP